jgi:hypothetical protein
MLPGLAVILKPGRYAPREELSESAGDNMQISYYNAVELLRNQESLRASHDSRDSLCFPTGLHSKQ